MQSCARPRRLHALSFFAHANCSLTGALDSRACGTRHGRAVTAGMALVGVALVQFYASWHVPKANGARKFSLRWLPCPSSLWLPLAPPPATTI